MNLKSLSIIATGLALVAGLGGVAIAAQNREALKVPGGLSFAEFKGYEDWKAVAVSQTPGSLKLISANAVMLAAYRAGLPADGKTFPEGSKVVKIEWASQPNPASPYAVQVPGAIKSLAFIEKDSKRFPGSHGWAYAKFDMDPATKTLKPEGTGSQCGYACHTGVAKQDYIFTAYPAR